MRGGVVQGLGWACATLVLGVQPAPGQDRIVFVSDRDGNREVYSMGPGGEDPINLTRHPGRDQAPAVAPDGRSIAWLSDRGGELSIWLMASDGSNQRLSRPLPEADFGLAWSPDGTRLALSLRRPEGESHDLAVLELSSGRLTRLTDTSIEEEITPSFDPEGEAIYYVAGSGARTTLMRMALGTGASVPVSEDLPAAAFPRVSPDGTGVVLRSRTDQFDVLRLDVATGTADNLTSHPANDWGGVWAADGESILFASDRDGDMEIYVMELASGALKQLTDNDARDWMPSR